MFSLILILLVPFLIFFICHINFNDTIINRAFNKNTSNFAVPFVKFLKMKNRRQLLTANPRFLAEAKVYKVKAKKVNDKGNICK